ncbi:CidA/LrgA family protein [Fibrobacter sp.]|uniref:CidA/LrgA family protein n=1 Tax=Fibrobacter sp. TaxID=35828 RepID=UPI0025C0884D|nr:CidA/LrgA family protein [Fibrobacter sp.]MBR3073548.1 CidA/LrgA family protein [Fibrobacter sp.]
MRVLLQLALILGICYVGDLIHDFTGIPIPGNILGMLILLLLLSLKIVKLEQIREISDFFLKRLAFFFLPPAIGLMLVGDDVKSQWPILLFLCIAITIVTMAATGWTVQLLCKKSKTADKNETEK